MATVNWRGMQYEWNCGPFEDGTYDHDWDYQADWYGDPEVINGTQDFYTRTCRACGVEEPVSASDMPTFEDDVL